MSGGDLAKAIVKTYIQDDQRIVDDQARAEFVGNRGSPLNALSGGASGAVPSAAETAKEMAQDVTLTAIDLQTFPALMDSLNKLSHSLQKVDPRGGEGPQQCAGLHEHLRRIRAAVVHRSRPLRPIAHAQQPGFGAGGR